MRTMVCSGFSPAGYDQYGAKFLDTFHKFWPPHVELEVYVERDVPMPRGRAIPIGACEGLVEFINANKDNAERKGLPPTDRWKERHRHMPYNFRFDVVKFCRQCFYPLNAARGLDHGDILVWLDADVITLQSLPKDFIASLLGDHGLVYLGRQGSHSEIGFWATRISDKSLTFLKMLAFTYQSGNVFNLPEWHSAFVFDHCRSKIMGLGDHNLTPNGRSHVWMQSPLAKYMDHVKGERRKQLGFSPERGRVSA